MGGAGSQLKKEEQVNKYQGYLVGMENVAYGSIRKAMSVTPSQ